MGRHVINIVAQTYHRPACDLILAGVVVLVFPVWHVCILFNAVSRDIIKRDSLKTAVDVACLSSHNSSYSRLVAPARREDSTRNKTCYGKYLINTFQTGACAGRNINTTNNVIAVNLRCVQFVIGHKYARCIGKLASIQCSDNNYTIRVILCLVISTFS